MKKGNATENVTYEELADKEERRHQESAQFVARGFAKLQQRTTELEEIFKSNSDTTKILKPSRVSIVLGTIETLLAREIPLSVKPQPNPPLATDIPKKLCIPVEFDTPSLWGYEDRDSASDTSSTGPEETDSSVDSEVFDELSEP